MCRMLGPLAACLQRQALFSLGNTRAYRTQPALTGGACKTHDAKDVSIAAPSPNSMWDAMEAFMGLI